MYADKHVRKVMHIHVQCTNREMCMARSLKPLLRSFETGSDWNGRKPSCFYNMFCVCIFDKKLGISVSLMWCFAHCANSGVFCSLSAFDTKKT